MRHTYDAGVVAEEEAGSTDEEAEEIGSEGAEPCAWKLRHANSGRQGCVRIIVAQSVVVAVATS